MIDIAIVLFYFVVVLWIGMKSGHNIQGIKEFSIGDRNFSVTVLVATLSGTLIGGGTTFGLAEKTFSFGLIFLVAYCGILVERIITAIFIADKIQPFFGLITAGDIMEKIYGKTAKILTGISTVTTSIFILGAHITTMGFILKSFLGVSLHVSLALSTLSMLIYSGYGGISAVSFTDVVQFGFMLVSIPLVALLSLMDIGGFKAIAEAVPVSHLHISQVDGDSLWQHSIIFFSYSLPALYPVIIQRMLMAKSTKQIKLSLYFNAALSLFFFSMMALIGLIALIKDPNLDPKQAFSSLILNSLPEGLRGLVIVGLLATVMSTVDSFLNLIGVSFTHDVLQPLMKKPLTSQQQLKIARFVTILIGLAGLVSALYFDGILENVFASMNLWLPFIFPPIFIGVLRNRGTQISFLTGIAAAVIVLGITRLAGYHDGFFPTILAASANTFALLITSKRSPERNLIRNKIAARIAILVQEIKATFTTNLPISDILSVFTLLFTVLPIIASAGTGARPARITIALSFALAILAVFFILKDLWFEKIKIKFPSYCLPILVATSQITMPSINVIASEFSALPLVNLFIGLALLFILHPGTGGIFWCITGIFTASLVVAFSSPLEFLGDTASQAMELTFRLLAMVYFVLYFRKQDRSRLERFNSLNGVLAHEVGHSITSMNFCAYRLRATLPILLDLYRNTHTNISNSISNSDLLALEELADRLKENANRTKSTVHIIQNKIHADSTPLEKQEVLVGKLIHEAINSGTKESINPNATIELYGKDFLVTVEIGSMVHVFINLLKNSLEALQNTPAPRIDIAIQAKQSSVRITDNGCGVPSDIRHQIFDENFSTKSNGQGKGLHFCKMVLAEFGASITCASKPGKTDFIIQFNHPNEQRGPA